jgi:hypothetical protein
MRLRTSRVLLILLAGAVIGFTIFGDLLSRAVTVERAEPPEALRRFGAVRAAFGTSAPLLTLDGAGNVTRRAHAPVGVRVRPVRLGVLAYQASKQRLVAADVPFWFFKLKGPAAQYAVRGTGLDLKRLGITASDLERQGPAVVIDHVRSNGDRLLVWTE